MHNIVMQQKVIRFQYIKDHLKGFVELTMIDVLEHAQWFSIN